MIDSRHKDAAPDLTPEPRRDTPSDRSITMDSSAELAAAMAEIVRLRAGYAEAIEDICEWAAYASPYFQEKWDFAGCTAAHRAILANRPGEAS